MKRNTHIIGSIIFALIGTLLIKIVLSRSIPEDVIEILNIFIKIHPLIFLIMIVASITGGIMPDILDPPFTKRHRRYAHSKILLLLFLIITLITIVLIFLNRDRLILWLIYYFLIGYISHLILDSFTPAGLWS